MDKIFFHADKYSKAVNRLYGLIPMAHSCRHIPTGAILININKLLCEPHGFLQNFNFDEQFSLCVSHEILHGILLQLIGSKANDTLDFLTVKFWCKGIDINTNLEVDRGK